jgi:hypothetical protein
MAGGKSPADTTNGRRALRARMGNDHDLTTTTNDPATAQVVRTT